jgi:hypothetical protein
VLAEIDEEEWSSYTFEQQQNLARESQVPPVTYAIFITRNQQLVCS